MLAKVPTIEFWVLTLETERLVWDSEFRVLGSELSLHSLVALRRYLRSEHHSGQSADH